MIDQTPEILRAISGGPALLTWMGGVPNFGDAEVLLISLDRTGRSVLSLKVQRRIRNQDEFVLVTFGLSEMLDIQIKGFSYQNVIAGLILRRCDPIISPSELGTDVVAGNIEIVLAPCFGAHGLIRTTIHEIRMERF